MKKTYQKNQNWQLFVNDDKLFITTGADEIYLVDEAMSEQVQLINNAYENDSWDELLQNHTCDDLIDQLLKAGVIYERQLSLNKKKTKIFVRYYGMPTSKLKNEISRVLAIDEKIELVTDMDKSDLMLLIRINVPLKKLLDGYEQITVPHLLVDLGYAHHLSLGPIVFSQTACLGCYVGRLAKNWGDASPPPMPAITGKPELIAALLREQTEAFAMYGNCPNLVNRVWNYDTKTCLAAFHRVYQLPWCPHCHSSIDNPFIDLPWEKEFRYD